MQIMLVLNETLSVHSSTRSLKTWQACPPFLTLWPHAKDHLIFPTVTLQKSHKDVRLPNTDSPADPDLKWLPPQRLHFHVGCTPHSVLSNNSPRAGQGGRTAGRKPPFFKTKYLVERTTSVKNEELWTDQHQKKMRRKNIGRRGGGWALKKRALESLPSLKELDTLSPLQSGRVSLSRTCTWCEAEWNGWRLKGKWMNASRLALTTTRAPHCMLLHIQVFLDNYSLSVGCDKFPGNLLSALARVKRHYLMH